MGPPAHSFRRNLLSVITGGKADEMPRFTGFWLFWQCLEMRPDGTARTVGLRMLGTGP